MANVSQESDGDLQELIPDLVRFTNVARNDIRQKNHCRLINSCLRHFGSERCALVGSSEEGTRVRASKDEGDYDFLIISEIQIPMEALEYREDMTCYVQIDGTNIQKLLHETIDLIDGHLPNTLLKNVHPAAFTALRGIYDICRMPGANRFLTANVQIDSECKPGFTLVEYFDWRSDIFSVVPRSLPTKDAGATLKCYEQSIKKSSLANNPFLLDIVKKVMDGFRNAVELISHVNLFTQGYGSLLKAIGGSSNTSLAAGNSTETPQAVCKPTPCCNSAEGTGQRQKSETSTQCTSDLVPVSFKFFTRRDFIAAFPLSGKPRDLDKWRMRERMWPPMNVVNDIADNTEFFVVAKPSPMAQENECITEFCLGYNMAEIKLARAMSPLQKRCLLIIKVYKKIHLQQYSEVLTSYHWKTAFYWKLEEEMSENFQEGSVLEFVRRVLYFMIESLQRRYLEHYFIRSNLFVGMNEEMCGELISKIRQLCSKPVSVLKQFLEDVKEGTCQRAWLPRKKVEEAKEIYTDPSHEKKVEAIVSALDHITRAIEKSPSYQNFVAGMTSENPVHRALLELLELGLKDMEEEKQMSAIQDGKTVPHLPVSEAVQAASACLTAEPHQKQERLNYLMVQLTGFIM